MSIFSIFKDIKSGKPENYDPLTLIPSFNIVSKAAPVTKVATKVTKSVGNVLVDAWKSLKPTTKIGLTVGGTALAIGATKSPQLREDIVSAPSKFVEVSQDFGTLYEDLRSDKKLSEKGMDALDFAKEHKVTTGLTILGLTLLGKGIPQTVSTFTQTKAINDQTDQLKKNFSQTYGNLQSNSGLPSSNKFDLKVEKEKADSALDIAKIQADAQQKMIEEQTKQLKMQLQSQKELAEIASKASPVTAPSVVETPTKKKTTKKKAKKKAKPKKKAKKKAKPKTIKRKTTKKKK